MTPTRRIIEKLAKEYLTDKNYQKGFINHEWIEKVTKELNLENLSDFELCNMWDMVYLTLENQFNIYDRNKDYKMAMKYLDVKSAFTEVINAEARKRRG